MIDFFDDSLLSTRISQPPDLIARHAPPSLTLTAYLQAVVSAVTTQQCVHVIPCETPAGVVGLRMGMYLGICIGVDVIRMYRADEILHDQGMVRSDGGTILVMADETVQILTQLAASRAMSQLGGWVWDRRVPITPVRELMSLSGLRWRMHLCCDCGHLDCDGRRYYASGAVRAAWQRHGHDATIRLRLSNVHRDDLLLDSLGCPGPSSILRGAARRDRAE